MPHIFVKIWLKRGASIEETSTITNRQWKWLSWVKEKPANSGNRSWIFNQMEI